MGFLGVRVNSGVFLLTVNSVSQWGLNVENYFHRAADISFVFWVYSEFCFIGIVCIFNGEPYKLKGGELEFIVLICILLFSLVVGFHGNKYAIMWEIQQESSQDMKPQTSHGGSGE